MVQCNAVACGVVWCGVMGGVVCCLVCSVVLCGVVLRMELLSFSCLHCHLRNILLRHAPRLEILFRSAPSLFNVCLVHTNAASYFRVRLFEWFVLKSH